jgi:hypothetical protein
LAQSYWSDILSPTPTCSWRWPGSGGIKVPGEEMRKWKCYTSTVHCENICRNLCSSILINVSSCLFNARCIVKEYN